MLKVFKYWLGGGIKSSKFVNSYAASSLSKDYPFQLITTFMLDLKLLCWKWVFSGGWFFWGFSYSFSRERERELEKWQLLSSIIKGIIWWESLPACFFFQVHNFTCSSLLFCFINQALQSLPALFTVIFISL